MTNRILLAALLTACLITTCSAQRKTPAVKGGFGQELTMRPNVKPAFRVLPMSHHFTERRGKLIPFEFEIESVDRATTINVAMVALKQDLAGTILPDTDSPAPQNVKLLTPAQMKLEDNEKGIIKCQVRVPNSNANFHSFGILVTDLGRIVDERPVRAADNVQRRVGIRFITRYMLRVDVSIKGARGEAISNLEIQSARLVEDGGYAKAQLLINNPTDSPLEFQTLCRLMKSGAPMGRSKFNLTMQNRASLESNDRNDIRILPGSKILLEEFLPMSVFPGSYELEADFVSNRRSRKKELLPITIQAGDFPAQDASVLQVGRDVSVSPANVELSLRKGGRRLRTIEIENSSQREVSVRLENRTKSVDGNDWLTIRPTELTLRAGSKRRVTMMLDFRAAVPTSQYADVAVNIHSDSGDDPTELSLPVAVLARNEQRPDLQLEPIQWDGDSAPPAFVAKVANLGEIHAPLRAKLMVVDAFGRRVDMVAGYGTWVLPGDTHDLRFRTRFAPPPGDYRYKLTLEGNETMESIELDGQIRFDQTGSSPSPASSDR